VDTTQIGHKILRHVLTDNAVPKDAFEGAKGVIFLQAAAAAVGLTAFRGQGFIIARVDGAWSAPAFIRLATMGMGLSLGGEMVDMVAILYTQADVDQYKSDDFKATANRMGNGLLAKHDASGPPKEPAVYSARSGKLMDFSLNRGSIEHDKLANARAYGTHVSPDDVLSNRVDPPSHMKEFYKELTGLGHISS